MEAEMSPPGLEPTSQVDAERFGCCLQRLLSISCNRRLRRERLLPVPRSDEVVAEFRDRDLHLVKKALAIAVMAIERQPGPFQSSSDQTDMKALLDRLIESDVELEHYARAARIAVTGKPD